MNTKIILGDLKISMCRYNDDTGESFEEKINIKKSPWYIYLTTKSTQLIEQNFEEIRKHKDHPNNYSYPISDFNKVVKSIKDKGYQKKLCNNPSFQNDFNGKQWKGGKGPINVGSDGFVWDGHHRCVALLYFLGDTYKLTTINNELEPIDPIN